MVTPVPVVVARYAQRAVTVSAAGPVIVRVKQRGRMRMKPGSRWLEFAATEYFAIDRVQFRWEARFGLMPLTWLTVTDGFEAGEGRLRSRLWGQIPVTRADGRDVTRAEAMRYLAELFWAPQAFLGNSELRWHDEGSSAARVTTAAAGEKYGVTFHFDAGGDITAVRAAARPRQDGKASVDTPWRGDVGEYVSFGGMRMPSRAQVSWELPDGLFTYWEGEVTSAEIVPAENQ